MEVLSLMRINGITVNLFNIIRGEVDDFNRPIERLSDPIPVDDVLVGYPSPEEINNTLTLYGKQVTYTLAIPKGDTHTWEGKVEIWGELYNIITAPTQGIESNIPLRWNKKVLVEKYPAPEDLQNG